MITRLYMETTKIEASQTVGEIQRLLGKYGCSAIMTEYDLGEVSGVAFKINLEGNEIPFRLPCRWESIYNTLNSRRKGKIKNNRGRLYSNDDMSQAKRVAWRQILRWVEAQLALVETNMVKMQEVFMPYIQVGIKGQTLYQQLENKKFKMLNSGKEE